MQKKILIAIQARSTSTRLPGKVLMPIDGRPMLDHMCDAAKRSADYLNRFTFKTGIAVHCCLVVPTGDEIVGRFKHKILCVEGSETDVLARYMAAVEQTKPDYIVRITSDCPLIPPYIISKHIKLAVVNGYDYISNVDPRFRTALDGADCEVISTKLLTWAHENAQPGKDREHVSILCRENPPRWARMAAVIGFFDESEVKLSVDTPEDLEAVRHNFERVKSKLREAEKAYGRENVHRF
jgi:spore coat polysaccharide biosynthesis protein SpsF